MPEGKELASAITVRLGMPAAAILGGFVGYMVKASSTPGQEGLLTWHTVVGAAVGFTASWAALMWLARRHMGAGVILGCVVTIAAAVALLTRFV